MLHPYDDKIIVHPDDPTIKTKGGLHLPGAGEQRNRGRVLAVGPGKMLLTGERAEMQSQLGDVVYYESYQGTAIKVGDQDLIILKESDILARYERDGEA